MRIWLLVLTMLSVSGCVHPANGPVVLMTIEPGKFLSGFQWAPDGRHLAVNVRSDAGGSASGRLTIIDIRTMERRDLGRCGPAEVPQYSPDGQRLLLVTKNEDVVFHSLTTGTDELVCALSPHLRSARVFLAPDGQHLAICESSSHAKPGTGFTNLLRLYAIRDHTDSILKRWEGYPFDGTWAPDGRHLLWTMERTGAHPTTMITDTVAGRTSTIYEGWSVFFGQCWSPDSKRAVGLDADINADHPSGIMIIDVETKTKTYLTRSGDMGMGGVAWSPKDQTVACTQSKTVDDRETTSIALYDPDNGAVKSTLGPFQGRMSHLAWSPSGDYLAFLLDDRVEMLRVDDEGAGR